MVKKRHKFIYISDNQTMKSLKRHHQSIRLRNATLNLGIGTRETKRIECVSLKRHLDRGYVKSERKEEFSGALKLYLNNLCLSKKKTSGKKKKKAGDICRVL